MKSLETIVCRGILLVAVTGMLAVHSASAKEPINTDAQGLAINGYDPVAYFTKGKPLRGSEEHTYQWMGAEWRFTSAEHLGRFKSSPEKYVPQYGGY